MTSHSEGCIDIDDLWLLLAGEGDESRARSGFR